MTKQQETSADSKAENKGNEDHGDEVKQHSSSTPADGMTSKLAPKPKVKQQPPCTPAEEMYSKSAPKSEINQQPPSTPPEGMDSKSAPKAEATNLFQGSPASLRGGLVHGQKSEGKSSGEYDLLPENDRSDPQQRPRIQSEPGRPVQLVSLNEEGGLILDEEALSRCMEQGGVEDAPVCLVSIIGEQRRGKSFLLNCLLRRLQSPEAADGSWLGGEGEALGGFECRTGTAAVTKGVWMWDQPLWIQAQGRKVALFLVDTEGSLDLQRRMETSIKLSVFSILLSSYWIFNISGTFKQTEADYLEMFVQVAKEVGKTCNLPTIQPLDLLVRDWQLSEAYGLDGGQEYLGTITRDLAASDGQPLVLGALTASGTRCYLLPHPGKGFIKNSRGTPHNMDEDFRHWLSDYVTIVAHSAETHVRMDQAGQPLTRAQLAERIKGISRHLNTKCWDFSSPVKMAESLAALREEANRRAVEATTREYEQFVQELDRGHQDVSACVRVTPAEMQGWLEGRHWELLQRCQRELLGDDSHRQAALQELEQVLDGQTAQFLETYGQRYERAETELKEANRREVEAATREYEKFVQELDRGHQDALPCVRVTPAEMQRQLKEKRWELLQRCLGELRGDDPHRQAALQELEPALDRQTTQFLETYRQRYERAETELKEANRRAVEATMREYEQFVQEMDLGHQDVSACLRVTPAEIQRRLEGRRQELLQRCLGELRGNDTHRQAALQELEPALDRQAARFLVTYGQRYEGPAVQPEPGCPVQLVRLDEEGGLILDEEALSHCLQQGEVGAAPVCLVSIVGEQRRGKSFLMNYLLRRLQSLEASEESWMGREDDPLEGFEWRMDTHRVTEGVWAWSQPFWVLAEGGKVAVLLIDTEGSMDIESNKETSIKLSALSMLLSSYQILNIGSRVKDTDLEYLEMFLHVAEVVGEAYRLEPIHHLDLLVRDWSSSPYLGDHGGKEYLRDVRQMLAAMSPCKHPKALEMLSRSSTRCYLMPFPGKGITTGSVGRLRDMDEDFQERLRGYVTALVGSVGQHIRTDPHGEPLTGTQLAAKIKNLSDVMKKCRFGFSSPCQMAITFHNQRAMDRARMDHAAFLREKDGLSQHRIDCLRVTPSVVGEQFVAQRMFLLERCWEEMKEPEKETLLAELEAELTQEAETFLETYGRCYQRHTINQRAMHRARTDHATFLREKDALSQDRIECLRLAPSVVGEQFMVQCMLLLERCQEEMMEPEKETLLAELDAELNQEAETFLETYGRRYQCHTINQRAMDRARTDHATFLREKEGLSQCRIDCLRVSPSVVGEQFVVQRMLLLERCRELMMEPEKETLLAELEAELNREAGTFLETYGRHYQRHTINQRAMDRARTDHTAFLREKDVLSQNRIECLKVTPSKMVEHFGEEYKFLLKRCQAEMMEPEETLLAELMAELSREAETFLETYGVRYQSHYSYLMMVCYSSLRDHSGSQKKGIFHSIWAAVVRFLRWVESFFGQ